MELHHKQNNLPKLSYMCWERDSGGFGFVFNLFSYFLNQLDCYCSVAQLCQTLCNSISPGLPVLHHLWEFAKVYVHCISGAIQPSHPLMASSPSAFILSQHQSLFNESALHIRGPKDWSFGFSINPSDEQMVKRVIGPQLESLIHILQLVMSMLSSIGFREKHTEYTKHRIGKTFSFFLSRHLD